jgi:cytochrome c-type biogenesis protein CcmH/NrfG
MADRDPSNVPLLLMLGKMLLRSREAGQALQVLERASALDTKCTDCVAHLAVAKALTGDTRQALAILQSAVADNPDHVLAWINLGIAYEPAGNPAEARKAYLEAIRLQPDSLEAKQRLSRLPK